MTTAPRRRTVLTAAATALLAGAFALPSQAVEPRAETGGESAAEQRKVLVFSKTAGFRHDSIPDGIAAVRQLGAQHGFTVDATEKAAAFTPKKLAAYDAVIFLSTTGDVLNKRQQKAFEGYIADGGGYVGVHAAADTEYDWKWYGGLAGAYFESHPAIQSATMKIEDRGHPATAHLGEEWNRTDEWYNYRSNPRARAHVLASLDENSYSGGTMGGDHPLAWCQKYAGGRAFYTGAGHTKESYTDPAFRKHCWAASGTRPVRPMPTAAPRSATHRCTTGPRTGPAWTAGSRRAPVRSRRARTAPSPRGAAWDCCGTPRVSSARTR